MIICVKKSGESAQSAKMLIYPAGIRFDMPVTDDFFNLPPHRMALTVAVFDGRVRELIDCAIECATEVEMDIILDPEEGPARQRVDPVAFRIAEGRMSVKDVETELCAVYDAYPEYSDTAYGGGDFLAMVGKFAEDPFYKLHHVAAEYMILRGTTSEIADVPALVAGPR